MAVKANIPNNMSIEYGSHWYMDRNRFNNKFNFSEFIKRIRSGTGKDAYHGTLKEQEREHIFHHYYNNYDEPELPPSWMITEILSLGTTSLLFERLASKKDQKRIADNFNLHPWVFQSWLHCLTHLRNICAHHGRLWNRNFKITLIEMKIHKKHFTPNFSFYAQASMLHVLLNQVSGNTHWQYRLSRLLSNHPLTISEDMGFPKNWQDDLFWALTEVIN